jgi:hypothetical protein
LRSVLLLVPGSVTAGVAYQPKNHESWENSPVECRKVFELTDFDATSLDALSENLNKSRPKETKNMRIRSPQTGQIRT